MDPPPHSPVPPDGSSDGAGAGVHWSPLGTVGSRDNITTRHSKHHNQENAKFCPFRLVWVNTPLSSSVQGGKQREAVTTKNHI